MTPHLLHPQRLYSVALLAHVAKVEMIGKVSKKRAHGLGISLKKTLHLVVIQQISPSCWPNLLLFPWHYVELPVLQMQDVFACIFSASATYTWAVKILGWWSSHMLFTHRKQRALFILERGLRSRMESLIIILFFCPAELYPSSIEVSQEWHLSVSSFYLQYCPGVSPEPLLPMFLFPSFGSEAHQQIFQRR